ncbi:MAG: metallophosphoesterase family protein [Sphingobium sp.]
MAFGLLKRSGKGQPKTGRGARIYAIGDIHGRFDLFRQALAKIEEHHSTLPVPQTLHVVLLGDLVDRGPESSRVVEFAHRLQTSTGSMICLKGNHEEMMVRAIDGEPGLMRAWVKAGGAATLRSYGVDVPESELDAGAATAELKRRVAPEVVEWMRTLPLTAQSGDYLFCHAGVRPGVPIKRQSRDDLLWIREEFLGSTVDHGAMIVHGHSVAAELEMKPNRIGIDTGAYRSGILSVLFLEGEKRDVISIRESELDPIEPDLDPAPRSAGMGYRPGSGADAGSSRLGLG